MKAQNVLVTNRVESYHFFPQVLSADAYKHVNVINRDTNQRVPITSGEMVVLKIYHWDEKEHLIYFKV